MGAGAQGEVWPCAWKRGLGIREREGGRERRGFLCLMFSRSMADRITAVCLTKKGAGARGEVWILLGRR